MLCIGIHSDILNTLLEITKNVQAGWSQTAIFARRFSGVEILEAVMWATCFWWSVVGAVEELSSDQSWWCLLDPVYTAPDEYFCGWKLVHLMERSSRQQLPFLSLNAGWRKSYRDSGPFPLPWHWTILQAQPGQGDKEAHFSSFACHSSACPKVFTSRNRRNQRKRIETSRVC